MGTSPTTYTYGYSTGAWGDQLTSFNGASITYDAVGNPLTYYNGSTFGWTGRSLTSATKGGASYTFTYDDGGIRQSKTKDGKTTTYYYDGGKLIAERNNDAAVIYIYDELGRPLGCRVFVFETDATFNAGYYVYDYWYVCNLQGDVVEMLDTNGNTVAIFSYDPYGNITSKAYSKGSPFAAYSNLYYRGYYYDSDLELYYVSSRYYDSQAGRWINADIPEALTANLEEFAQYNLFAYCFNNPVNMSDETGAWPSWLKKAIAVVTVAAVVVAATAITVVSCGGGTVAGVAMITTTATLAARTTEVAFLQAKKGKLDGKSGSQIVKDTVESIYDNGSKIVGLTPATKTAGIAVKHNVEASVKKIFGETQTLNGTLKSPSGKAISFFFVAIAWAQTIISAVSDDPVTRANERGYALK